MSKERAIGLVVDLRHGINVTAEWLYNRSKAEHEKKSSVPWRPFGEINEDTQRKLRHDALDLLMAMSEETTHEV